MAEQITPDLSEDKSIREKTEVERKLPEWVIEQSRDRSKWFEDIYHSAMSIDRPVMLSPQAASYRDVVVGAKPATDFMYYQSDQAERFGRLAESVPPPETVPPRHLQLIQLKEENREIENYLVNLHALPHIVAHNEDIFKDFSTIVWKENALPVITDPQAFLTEGFEKQRATFYGLLMGFPRHAVEHWKNSNEKDPTGLLDCYVREEIKSNYAISKLWEEYQKAHIDNRAKMRPILEEKLKYIFPKVRRRVQDRLDSGNILAQFQTVLDDQETWDILKSNILDSRFAWYEGISYRTDQAGPDEDMETYRLVHEASEIDRMIKKLSDEMEAQAA